MRKVYEFSAGAFIYRVEQGKMLFLLLKKPNGEWDVPKGHIEKGETADIAAKREILEESGIRAQFIPSFSIVTKYIFRRPKELVFKQVKYFLSQTANPEVKISLEHIGYRWATHEEGLKMFKFKDLRRVFDAAYEYALRQRRMDEINSRYAKLSGTAGWSLSKNLVPGEGSLDSGVMMIGQAPGADEDEQRRPFIGRSGRLLDGMIKKVNMSRNKIYITSVVQFFPPKNRLPERSEVKMCLPFLMEQIGVVKPKYVMLMGNLSSSVLAGITGVETYHGNVIEKDGIKYMITLHPAAILRFPPKSGMMLSDFKKFKKMMYSAGEHER